MDLRFLYFASSLMLVLVTCSAQTGITGTTGPPGTEIATDVMTTTVMEPDTNAANNTTTKAPSTEAPTKALSTKTPVTDAPTTKKMTESPAVGTTEKAADGGNSKGFSAGSFFGGIILAVAVLGIGFCGFKFYQSRQDKNYQTL
ncbi:porimin-like [Strongylocentrotus purpuratus]|uniref:Sialomucin core protein 24 n=1 Tax=Strongylocentrotus purpuratus TaxID=7668 RepID=A0A7M7T3J6_STRPU|nr:porimin-like [Strongylocentrotus purpuratus]|eukprot:XP_001198184.2 PREDICTED: porimin-like [Strongylocentrotus purpuratus]